MTNIKRNDNLWTTAMKWLAGILLTLGLGFFCWTIVEFLLIFEMSDNPTSSDMAETGQIGDFIGGILNPIWSLAGILLFYIALKYQRDDLNNQIDELTLTRQELADTRNEFHTNRITSILYNQLARIDNNLTNIEINGFRSYQALAAYNDRFFRFDNAEDDGAYDLILFKNHSTVNQELSMMTDFVSMLHSNIAAIEYVLDTSSLTLDHQNQFKSLIRLNIGAEVIRTINILNETTSNFIKSIPRDEWDYDTHSPYDVIRSNTSQIMKALLLR